MSGKDPATMEKRRQHVIDEIINTEITYNIGLQKIEQLVTIPLLAAKKAGELTFIDNSLLHLFEMVKDVQSASSKFQEKLECIVSPEKRTISLGDCFTGFSTLISVYFDYIKFYNAHISKLKPTYNNNTVFRQIIQTAEESIDDSLESLLIYPVQRPPRYKLLLKELIKTLPPDSPDLAPLNKALNEMCDAISTVDKEMAIFEEACKMAELQQKISDFNVYAVKGRRLFFEVSVVKFSRKWNNQRYLVLFSDCLLILETGVVTQYKVNKIYKSGEYMIVGYNDRPPFKDAIDVRQKDKSFRANLPNSNDKFLFLQNYDSMLEYNKLTQAQIATKGFAPVWIPDTLAPTCMRCGKEFSLTKRRHHCRYCGDCICSNCCDNKIIIPGHYHQEKVCSDCYQIISKLYEDPYISKKNEVKIQTENTPSHKTNEIVLGNIMEAHP